MKIKRSHLFKIGIMILILSFSFFLWQKGKVYGGRLACYNMQGFLKDDWSCWLPPEKDFEEEQAWLDWKTGKTNITLPPIQNHTKIKGTKVKYS